MLDYNKLSEEFTKKLNTFDKGKLIEWIDFDASRILAESSPEKSIVLDSEIISDSLIISDPKENVEADLNDFTYMSYDLAA